MDRYRIYSLLVLGVVALATLASTTYLGARGILTSDAIMGLLGAVVGAVSAAAGVQVANGRMQRPEAARDLEETP